MIDENGKVNENALKIRITDNYIDTLSQIYKEVKIVGLPGSAGASSSSSANGNAMSAETLATAMVMFNHVGGNNSAKDLSASDLHNVQHQLASMRGVVDDIMKNSRHGSNTSEDGKVRYLDNKALY